MGSSAGSSSPGSPTAWRSEEHTSELQSREKLVCRLLLEKKKFLLASSSVINPPYTFPTSFVPIPPRRPQSTLFPYTTLFRSISTAFDGGTLVLYAVAAAVIGGTSLFGGRGKALHGVLGGVVIAGIANGMEIGRAHV